MIAAIRRGSLALGSWAYRLLFGEPFIAADTAKPKRSVCVKKRRRPAAKKKRRRSR